MSKNLRKEHGFVYPSLAFDEYDVEVRLEQTEHGGDSAVAEELILRKEWKGTAVIRDQRVFFRHKRACILL